MLKTKHTGSKSSFFQTIKTEGDLEDLRERERGRGRERERERENEVERVRERGKEREWGAS